MPPPLSPADVVKAAAQTDPPNDAAKIVILTARVATLETQMADALARIAVLEGA